MVYPINVASNDKKIQTWPAAAVTTFLRKFRTPAMIDPIIPGRAAADLLAILPRSLVRPFSLFLNHSLSLFGCFGEDPPAPAAPAAQPVSEAMIVEMIYSKTVNTAVFVITCSLKMSLTFSRRVRSPSRIFLSSAASAKTEIKIFCDVG